MKKDLPLTALVRSFVTMAFLTSSSLGVMADNPRKSATNLQFYTYVSASESRDAGFYTFNSSNPTVFTLVGNDVKCYGGATYAQGKFWSSYYEENEDNSKITFPIHLQVQERLRRRDIPPTRMLGLPHRRGQVQPLLSMRDEHARVLCIIRFQDSDVKSRLVEEKEKASQVLNFNNLARLSAVRKGLEPSTSGVTGRHSNQLNYRTLRLCIHRFWLFS